jgi:hypothetical protein
MNNMHALGMLGIVALLGGCSSGANDEPCEELSEQECYGAYGCLLVKARRLVGEGENVCGSDDVKVTCRSTGEDCTDGDAVSYWCDMDGNTWETPQTCGPVDTESCRDTVAVDVPPPCD